MFHLGDGRQHVGSLDWLAIFLINFMCKDTAMITGIDSRFSNVTIERLSAIDITTTAQMNRI